MSLIMEAFDRQQISVSLSLASIANAWDRVICDSVCVSVCVPSNCGPNF